MVESSIRGILDFGSIFLPSYSTETHLSGLKEKPKSAAFSSISRRAAEWSMISQLDHPQNLSPSVGRIGTVWT